MSGVASLPRGVIVDVLLPVLAGALAIGWRAAGARARVMRELDGEARLERGLREVAAAAAGAIEERELAALVAARLGELLGASTSAVIRADPDCLLVIGYSGPTPYPERLGWDEASSSAQAVRTGGPARLEDYGAAGEPRVARARDGRPDAAVPAPRRWPAPRTPCSRSARATARARP